MRTPKTSLTSNKDSNFELCKNTSMRFKLIKGIKKTLEVTNKRKTAPVTKIAALMPCFSASSELAQ
jgi:hypothetical protein